mmetsp:Transcript_23338/g.28922  ORF Transcript_23338/g.28922 Transcript_23338/m.28922 type:complete len:237 (+) Transcript_23338:808-1518(+)
MGNISHEKCADFVSDLAIARVIEVARVSAGTAEKDIGAKLFSGGLEGVHVDQAGLLVDEVGSRLEVVGAGGDFLRRRLMTVREVTAMRQREAHDAATGRHKTRVHGKVGRAARERLHVDRPLLGVGTEGLKSALLAKELYLVDDLIATVIAASGVSLGVLVGEAGAKGLHDSLGREVLARNELNSIDLSSALLGDKGGHLGVDLADIAVGHGEVCGCDALLLLLSHSLFVRSCGLA